MFKNKMVTALSLGIAMAVSGVAHAGYPERSVTIVVPYPPGGTTDLLARLVSMKLTKSLGQTFIVENKPGAGGQIGTLAVARAKPDGYTLVMGTINTHGINAAMYKKLAYRTVEDFAPVIIVADTPNVMIANKNAPFKTFEEFIAYAKKIQAQSALALPAWAVALICPANCSKPRRVSIWSMCRIKGWTHAE